ncbi:hypothetical protein NL321_29275, partial [Klebsiella pneumoniae]|nr:hypothetical protein [Klebsiella pneumoniae]
AEGRREAMAARMRAAYCEMYADAITRYADLMLRYQKVKKMCADEGINTDTATDKKVTDHFDKVTAAASRRMKAGFGSAGSVD